MAYRYLNRERAHFEEIFARGPASVGHGIQLQPAGHAHSAAGPFRCLPASQIVRVRRMSDHCNPRATDYANGRHRHVDQMAAAAGAQEPSRDTTAVYWRNASLTGRLNTSLLLLTTNHTGYVHWRMFTLMSLVKIPALP